MTEEELLARAEWFGDRLDKIIQLADDEQDLKILSFVMMNKSCHALDMIAGEEERKFHFREFS